MTNGSEAIQRVAECVLGRSVHQIVACQTLLVGEGNIVHFRIHTSIDFADSLLATDVEEENLFVCAYTDGEGAIGRHLNAMNVATVSAQISDVDSRLRVPHLNVFVDLAS